MNLSFAFTIVLATAWLAAGSRTWAEEPRPEYELPSITVPKTPQIFFDEPLVDNKIVSGKKVTRIEKSELPPLPNNNFRQLVGEIPGLMISEVNNESWASLTYRGLGDPHESFNILTLRNGLPATPDPYGYPAGYYSPPFEALERVEFVRGGSGLLYGPQPGGAFNYRLREAPSAEQNSRLRTTNLGGSFGRFSTYNEHSMGRETWGSLVSFHERGSQGFRQNNADTNVINPRANLRYNLTPQSWLRLDLDFFQGRYGEPGGLAKTPGAGLLTLDNPEEVTLNFDRLEIDRTGLVLSWDYEWSTQTSSSIDLWGTYFRRESFRQPVTNPFGRIATSTTNVIQNQVYNTFGAQAQVKHTYQLFGQNQILTLAYQGTRTDSPFTQANGSTPNARAGSQTRDLERKTASDALVFETAIEKGSLTFIPAVRAESIRQEINEKLNVGSAVPLRQDEKDVSVLLLGLGLEYDVSEQMVLYANASQGYKPPAFQDSIPLGTGDTISEDLGESKTLSKEIGVRGPWQNFEYDISIFQVDHSDLIGRVSGSSTNLQNIGASRAEGLDILIAAAPSPKWRAFVSASFLKSRFVEGPLNGNKTQYSPDQALRAGLTYSYAHRSRVRLQGQSLPFHYGDDNNSSQRKLEGSTTFDLAGEHHLKILTNDGVTLLWGVQNLTNQDNPQRVRANGFEPAQPISFHGGFSAVF